MSDSDRRPRVAVAGHLCVDLMPALGGPPRFTPGIVTPVGRLAIRPGGCVANTGGDLAALGLPVQMFASLGDDELAIVLRSLLDAPGVDLSGVRTVSGAATSYSVVLQAPGTDRAIWHYPGANDVFDGDGIDVHRHDLLHLGYPPLVRRLWQDGGDRLRSILEAAHEARCTTSLDLATVDAASEASQRDWRRLLERVLPHVDVFSPSLDDLSSLGVRHDGDSAAPDAAIEAIAAGAAVVMIKAGERGLYLRGGSAARLRRAGWLLASQTPAWAGCELTSPAVARVVVGTTGAGDAAVAGLLFGLAHGTPPERALWTATLAAAARVSRPGPLAPLPTLERELGVRWTVPNER